MALAYSTLSIEQYANLSIEQYAALLVDPAPEYAIVTAAIELFKNTLAVNQYRPLQLSEKFNNIKRIEAK